jgi:hypothetical protein
VTANAERRPDRGRRVQNLTTTAAKAISSERTAVDAAAQISEAIVWLEAVESTLCAGLLGIDGLTLTEAAEHVVVLHGRVRRCLDFAVVT